MADGHQIGKRKFAIFLQLFNRSRRNFARTCKILKFAYFRNSRRRTGAILEIKNSQYFHNRSTYRDEMFHEHADCGCEPCEKLKFAYLRNSICWTAAILEICYISATVHRITTKFCMNMQMGAAKNVEG